MDTGGSPFFKGKYTRFVPDITGMEVRLWGEIGTLHALRKFGPVSARSL